MKSPRPPIALAGAGAVAQALGHLLYVHGEPVVAVASRRRWRAERAARFIGPSVQTAEYSQLPGFAARVLIAVSDDAIPLVAEELSRVGMRRGAALHTCGSRGPEALASLRAQGVACGVLHPLQTVASPEQGVKSLQGVTFGLAGDGPALDWAEEIVALVDGRPLRIAAERFSRYHAGAVMASNALMAVIDAALVLMADAGVEREAALRALAPLARTSVENAVSAGPRAALTGPIARGDAATVAEHIDALNDAPATVVALYRAAARHLLELARERGLPEANVRALEVVLDA